MKLPAAITGAVMSLVYATGALAQPYLVDTGAGTASSGLILDGDPQVLDWTQSWHAGLFSLSEESFITGMEAWMSVGTAGEMTMALYDADEGLPRSGPSLFTATFTLGTGGRDWYGIDGLKWRLDAGSYWINLEPAKTSTFSGALWMVPPEPLTHYAESIRGTTWEYDPAGRDGPDRWGLRISGAAVPEPATWFLLLIGFGGLGAALRRSSGVPDLT